MKNLLLVIADLFLSKSGTYRWIAVLIMSKIRFISLILVLNILNLIVIGSGLNLIMSDLRQTTETQHQLALTSLSAVGFGMIILSLTAICLFFKKSFWEVSIVNAPTAESTIQHMVQEKLDSPLAKAVSALVMDYVEERRHRRQHKSKSVEQIQV